MKRKIAYADRRELNGEPIGTPGVPVDLDFLPTPVQVRRTLKTFKVTVDLEPASVAYYRREARRRGETPAETGEFVNLARYRGHAAAILPLCAG